MMGGCLGYSQLLGQLSPAGGVLYCSPKQLYMPACNVLTIVWATQVLLKCYYSAFKAIYGEFYGVCFVLKTALANNIQVLLKYHCK